MSSMFILQDFLRIIKNVKSQLNMINQKQNLAENINHMIITTLLKVIWDLITLILLP